MDPAEPSWWSLAVRLLTVPVLVLVNGAFVAAQFSLVALRQTRVEEMVRQGVAGARSVRRATDDLDRCVAATQVGTVLTGLLLGWFGEPAVADLLRPLFTYVEEQWHLVALHSVSTVVAFCLITFLSVVFGELIPKTIGLQDSERTALLVANPLLTFTRLTGPLVAFMDGVGNRILRRFGYELEGEGEKAHSVEELILLIEDTAEAGVISEHQAKFVRNILRLSQRKVADVIIPMEKVGKLDYEASPELILQRVREGTFTRMPVYHRDVNHILGVANTKQMLRLFAERGKVALEEVLYPAVFVAPDDPLPLAMSRMREAKFPLAVVRDAAGTVHGVVAVEDVVEQVMGEFTDEHDYPAPKVTPRMLQALIKAVPRRKLDAPGKAEPAAAV